MVTSLQISQSCAYEFLAWPFTSSSRLLQVATYKKLAGKLLTARAAASANPVTALPEQLGVDLLGLQVRIRRHNRVCGGALRLTGHRFLKLLLMLTYLCCVSLSFFVVGLDRGNC